mgnify:CR=1 FL=1
MWYDGRKWGGGYLSSPATNISKITTMKTNCIKCGKEFIGRNRKERKHKTSLFCSTTCSGNWRRDKNFSQNSCFKKGLIPWNKGKPHSEETKRKMSVSARKPKPHLRGEKSHFWKGGRSDLYKRIKQSYQHRNWVRKILKRDNYLCYDCGTHKELQIHHIKQIALILDENNIETVDDAINCKELWETKNGKTLCHKCHKLTDTYGVKGKLTKLTICKIIETA